ncbi:LysR family transcriptional regulator [Litoreibacter albidus]|uniref:Transcriptional regulator, LysR family n=1 Tax=Litoreibacter albidus TaxID=670155 RepID=A0A1H3D741_9RHOB|nr:LysR family transcriptional regulator [Litoreibacter albidus]SDX62283.1 transcriptional regulator, LysR family [Litoreibacter albidus]
MKRFSNTNAILAFVTVAREGSVSKAAEVLSLTQPAVSHQIKRLAEETGMALFQRTPTGLRLTHDGEAILPKAVSVLTAMSDFHRSANKQSGQVTGTLKIGTIVDPEFIRLGQLLSRLGTEFPSITTELMHGVSGDVLDRLKRGVIDAGFYLSARDETEQTMDDDPIHFEPLADFSYSVIAPVGWDARVRNASWAELAGLPWIGTPAASVHNRLLTDIFEAHNCVQNVVSQVDQEASMLAMVRVGVGLSLCRDSIALHQQQTFGLTICNTVSVPARLSIATFAHRKDNAVIGALFSQLKGIW